MWLLDKLFRPSPVKEAFQPVAKPKTPFVDPYQRFIDNCTPHPKDASVLITSDRENLSAIHSPHVAAVILLRETSEELKNEAERLQSRPDIADIANTYRWGDNPPEDIPHIRQDLREIAKLRAELAGESLSKPILIAASNAANADSYEPKNSMTGDESFHSDRDDVGLRLHTTYSGPTIEGLSKEAIDRLEGRGLSTNPTWEAESAELTSSISPDDLINDIPLFAVVAFKGKGYQPPQELENAPEHIFWRHRGPNRETTNGIAAIFGLPYSEARRFEPGAAFPEAKI